MAPLVFDDYHRVNEITHKDAYPIPRVDDAYTLDTLSGSGWFSTLDLKSGHWQVEVTKEDRAGQLLSMIN